MGLAQNTSRKKAVQKVAQKEVEITMKALKRKGIKKTRQQPTKAKQAGKSHPASKAVSSSQTAKEMASPGEESGAVGYGLSAEDEVEDLRTEEGTEEDAVEEHLRKDYPDTRTIDDAGRSTSPGDAKKAGSAAETPTKTQKPPSAYKETWQVQKAALKNKFGEDGWKPRKKLSPDTMDGIRALHAQYPDRYPTAVLAEHFAVSPEAVRRILKSKWSSNLDPEKAAERKERWAKRHDRIWDVKSQIGLRPPRKGAKAVEDPDQFEEELRGRQLLEAHRNS